MRVSEELELKLSKLPAEYYDELNDFIDFLIEKKGKKFKGGMLNQNWAGSLCEQKKHYTSIELQRKAFERKK
ncbi:MAG: DUF2281 domain-containing protein [Bacteroidia bacterium]|nr:DUF2281 domain-containing protein [Bacteroidia bacterium]